MRVTRGPDDARRFILRRPAADEIELPPAAQESIQRVFGAELSVEQVVERIIHDVRERGDDAVRRYNREIDGVQDERGDAIEVEQQEFDEAYGKVAPDLVEALEFAADRIADFHRRQMEHAALGFQDGGVGQMVGALDTVGMYVPGTTTVYPSTVLMIALPARAAGVRRLVMATPAMPDGCVSPIKLVAARIAGVDAVVRAGGVQGIAALAYGTETVPAVDKICGPGNVFVTEAKKRVYGTVGLDGVFGPSETVVIADDDADTTLVAADLLAGAEHDQLATAVLICISQRVADGVLTEVEFQLKGLDRADIARASMETQGGAVIVDDLEQAVDLASEFAPEHLCLHVREPDKLLERVRNAGAVFAGEASVESIGDYTAGPSHVMPTGGSARFESPLGVHDFLKITSIVAMDDEALRHLGPAAAAIARAEGFVAHARAIERRLERGP